MDNGQERLDSASQQGLRDMNEALLVSSVRQHELADQAQKAEAALRQSEVATRQLAAELEVIYRTSPVGMLQLDRELRYVRINDVMAAMNGLPAADHLGRTVREVVPGLADQVEPAYRRILGTGEPVVDIEISGQTPAQPGVQHTWLQSWYPLRNAAGGIVGINVLAQDVTERREADEALRRHAAEFETLLNGVPLGLYVVDGAFRIRHVNAATSHVFGDIPDLVGRDFDEVVRILWPKEYADEIVRLFRRTLETGEPYVAPERTEERLDRGATEIYEWQISRIPLPEGGYGVVCYFRDISERARLNDELRRYAGELSEADRRKNEFLAMLAHELRNPLAPIRNAAQVLRLSNGDADAAHSAAAMMERQVGQMVRLVDDLLDVSRVSRGKIELRRGRVELASAIHHAVEAARTLVQCRKHELTVTLPPEPVYLDADPTRLAQVVGNLLNNACKFTDPGGRISLTVERDGGMAVIRVRDSGVGLAADQLPRVFDLFTQVDTSLERSVGGLGIGLTLVKSLVEMHGGTVEVRSAGIGRGSEFAVRLPALADTPAASREATRGECRPTTGRRILVVDDNRDSAESLAMLLGLTGNETRTAHDGVEAVDAAAAFLPDAILLDIGLPRMNGYEAARTIREHAWGKGMVLVALTGWGQDEDRRKSTEAGFDGHLVKPVDYAVLTELLAALLPPDETARVANG